MRMAIADSNEEQAAKNAEFNDFVASCLGSDSEDYDLICRRHGLNGCIA